MFRGGYNHTIDDKGRIIIPQKFRYVLGDKFVVTKGMGRCLWILTEEEFRKLDEKIQERPMLDLSAVRLQRFFTGEALDASTDVQGRIALPQNLREYAGIEKDVMVVGAGNRIEMWSKQRWDETVESLTDEVISESAKEIGLG